MAVVDTEKQLAWEARQRPRAGVAALIAGAAGFLPIVTQATLVGNVPNASFLASLQQAVRPGPVARLETVRLEQIQYLHDHAAALIAFSVGAAIGWIALAYALGFLAVATRARRAEFPRWGIYVPIIGGVLYALGALASGIGQAQFLAGFLDGPHTVARASDTTGLMVFAAALSQVGGLVVAVGMMLTALNARRAGLLTGVFGILGVIIGPLLVLAPPLGTIMLAGWGLALAFVFFGIPANSGPPAWRTGRAEAPPPRRGARVPAPQPDPAPETPAPPRGSTHRKRKKR